MNEYTLEKYENINLCNMFIINFLSEYFNQLNKFNK